MRRQPTWVTTLCLALIVGGWTLACSGSPTSPAGSLRPPAEPPPREASRTVSVVSGWDQTPVPHAQVRMDGAALTTDANGKFEWPRTVPPEATLDVDAAGFLPHRTRMFGVRETYTIALWPAANEAEAAAIKAMAFGIGDRLGSRPWTVYQLALVLADPARTASVFDDWSREYEEIRILTGLALSLSPIPRGGGATDEFDSEVIVMFDETDACKDLWGFCYFVGNDSRFGYFALSYRMSLTMAARPGVIKRVLASGLLNANPLPGLLNKTAPAAELSLLEKQTLKMQSIRGGGTRWPDTAGFR